MNEFSFKISKWSGKANPFRSNILNAAMRGLALSFVILAGTTHGYAHEAEEAAFDEKDRYFEALDASRGLPEGFDERALTRTVVGAGGTEEDVKEMIAILEGDMCEREDLTEFCAYVGAETLYKVRNNSWRIARAGGSRDQALKEASAILEIGIVRNLAELYGEKGLTDEAVAKLDGGGSKRAGLFFRCENQIQQLSTTNPFYGRDYKLTTCGTGLGWRISFVLWPFNKEFSLEWDLLISHSRFSRKIGVWHLTGAEPHICANSEIAFDPNNQCNFNSWSSPVSLNSGFFVNQPIQPVIARGHAHRLGTPFNIAFPFQ